MIGGGGGGGSASAGAVEDLRQGRAGGDWGTYIAGAAHNNVAGQNVGTPGTNREFGCGSGGCCGGGWGSANAGKSGGDGGYPGGGGGGGGASSVDGGGGDGGRGEVRIWCW